MCRSWPALLLPGASSSFCSSSYAQLVLAFVMPNRRAGAYRYRANQLREIAAREPHEDRRRHMLELAAQYQRAADGLARWADRDDLADDKDVFRLAISVMARSVLRPF